MAEVDARRPTAKWHLATVGVIAVDVLVRVLLGGASVGDRSAIVLVVLLALGVWAATALVANPRTALFVVLGVVAITDLAALPPRSPGFDDREALYRTDQAISLHVTVDRSATQDQPVLTMLAEGVFTGDQPPFGLRATVGGTQLDWQCPLPHGLTHVALPLPGKLVAEGGNLDVTLRLNGTPSREQNYLLVYGSAQRGGYVADVTSLRALPADATLCTPQ